ncbi:hypothetical protein LMG28688_00606 [Paraburkholderia caffeinitolerans]|uniref:Carboxylesterase n=1 Tax=Paraburkholderia caffeinitolerans TaxID=1723730 RepID=A0A6J5FFL4_9BURK|nr:MULTISPECIES: DUF1254 domain-containing protein [Paraburkholderia]CAB3778497.1 hypothetical protein LMG28688_00606 [Paraburkholderia caffeinitolerans]
MTGDTVKLQHQQVTADNYTRAETDQCFGAVAARGALGRFAHRRAMVAMNEQFVVRPNRDTLYSTAIFDLQAGPVTVILPDAGRHYLSMQVIDQDHYTQATIYAPGPHSFCLEQTGSRYLLVAVRILANPDDPADMKRAHALQDAIEVQQRNSGSFDAPNWDLAGLKSIRNALLVLGTTVHDTHRMFGGRDRVDPVRHLIGTAMAWGGIPEQETLYLPVTPPRNDGVTVHRMTVGEVPVDGFWSVSVYNEKGYFEPNSLQAYSVNNLTAKRSADGTVTIQFGGCDTATPNCLPIMPGWNYLVRLYRPRPEVLAGDWRFPLALPVS